MYHANTGALDTSLRLPWAGMPNVACKLTSHPNGDMIGELTIHQPQGGEPIVLRAKGNVKEAAQALLKRYAPQVKAAKASGYVGLFGFLKKIYKGAQKLVRGKLVRKLVAGFGKIISPVVRTAQGVMKMPLIGPALSTAFPPAAATFAALKGAQNLGLSPWQVRRMKKAPRHIRRKLMRKLRKRAQWLQKVRWRQAQMKALGRTAGDAAVAGQYPGEYGAGSPHYDISGMDTEVFQADQYGLTGQQAAEPGRVPSVVARSSLRLAKILIIRSKRGDRKARKLVGMLRAKARAGHPNAARGWRILQLAYRDMILKRRAKRGGEAVAGQYPGDYGASSPVYDISGQQPAAPAYGAGSPVYDISGQGQAPMSLHNYWTIGGQASPEDFYDGSAPAGWGQAATCEPVAGEHYAIGAQGQQLIKTWNGVRWIWSELQPHMGIRSETQGFGLRDALLLGMRNIQQRELAA